MGATPKAVPSAVAPSTGANNIPVLTTAQLGPYKPMTGSARIPVVPRTPVEGTPSSQPGYGGGHTVSQQVNANGTGAPTVPEMNGALFRKGPIDSHYTSETQAVDPYKRVNSPQTRGMFTFIKSYLNHIALGPQVVDQNGFRVSPPQQRTSFMRVTPPPHGIGYAPETFTPHQLPQAPNTYKYAPATGTQPYGTGVLNSDTYGAGQTAGGIGGSNYSPQPAPPVAVPVIPPDSSGMPVWG